MSRKSGQVVVRHPATGTPCNPVLFCSMVRGPRSKLASLTILMSSKSGQVVIDILLLVLHVIQYYLFHGRGPRSKLVSLTTLMSSKSGQGVSIGLHPATGTPCNPVLPVPW